MGRIGDPIGYVTGFMNRNSYFPKRDIPSVFLLRRYPGNAKLLPGRENNFLDTLIGIVVLIYIN